MTDETISLLLCLMEFGKIRFEFPAGWTGCLCMRPPRTLVTRPLGGGQGGTSTCLSVWSQSWQMSHAHTWQDVSRHAPPILGVHFVFRPFCVIGFLGPSPQFCFLCKKSSLPGRDAQWSMIVRVNIGTKWWRMVRIMNARTAMDEHSGTSTWFVKDEHSGTWLASRYRICIHTVRTARLH